MDRSTKQALVFLRTYRVVNIAKIEIARQKRFYYVVQQHDATLQPVQRSKMMASCTKAIIQNRIAD